MSDLEKKIITTQGVVRNKRTKPNGEGSIYFNKVRKVWTGAFYDIHGKRRVASFKDRDDVVNWIGKQKEARERGEGIFAKNPKQTVAQFLDEWLVRRVHQIRPSTTRTYEQSIKNQIKPNIGHLNAAKLRPIIIEEMLGALIKKGYKAGTVKLAIRVLSKAYNDGVRLDLVAYNPMKKVEVPNLKSIPLPPIPWDELRKLYGTAESNPYSHARLVLAAEVGERPGEARGFKWSDVDEVHSTISIKRQVERIKGKGLHFSATKIPQLEPTYMTPRAMNILLVYKRHQKLNKAKWKVDLDLIFPNSKGKMMDETRDKKWFKDLCAEAGIPPRSLYQLRKNCFTQFMSVSDLGTTMKFTGHTQSSTLMNSYISPASQAVKDAVLRSEATNPALRKDVG